MNSAQKVIDVAHTDRTHRIAADLKASDQPIRLIVDEEGVVFEAYVSSGQAAKMLAPLGSGALGAFTVFEDNMVLVEGIFSLDEARMMLATMMVQQ